MNNSRELVSIIRDLVIGGVLGLSVVFLSVVATVAYAFFTAAPAKLPFIILAEVGQENDLPAISFEPNFSGMLLVAMIIAVVFSIFMFSSRRLFKGATGT